MRLSEFNNTPNILDKPTPTVANIVKLHNVDYKYVMHQLQKGIQVELEHTSHIPTAKEIALDHLLERPDYYERLEKVESTRKAIQPRNLETESRTLPVHERFTRLQIAIMEGGHSLND